MTILVSFMLLWALMEMPNMLMKRDKPWEVDWDGDSSKAFMKANWERFIVFRRAITTARVITLVLAAISLLRFTV